ncbi:hypothetical protein TeGR_g6357 [Tetraparma gracilis]|uniref:Amino acid transporter transmembrane domain-containing protein n=1 Tax=Tetraparma gracilis TaxID=2962635 RepID=A0ABQ6NAS6_9STRA|nr:hypothetical protein TeGR_g6357 [Tetraparma gracilis]
MDALPLLHEYSALATSPSKAASKVSTSTTAFQIVTTMAGTGILQLPYTVAQGGWITLFLLLLVAAITNWTNRLLVASLYLGPTADRLPGYPEVGKAAFGYTGYVLVQIFHKFTLFGVSSIFLILAAKFLTEGLGGDGDGLLDHTSFFSPGTDWTKIWTIVSAICVLFPVIYYRTLGEN